MTNPETQWREALERALVVYEHASSAAEAQGHQIARAWVFDPEHVRSALDGWEGAAARLQHEDGYRFTINNVSMCLCPACTLSRVKDEFLVSLSPRSASPKRPEVEEVAKAALNAAVASCELRPIPPVTIERALASRRDVLSATVDWQAVAVDVIALIFGEPKTEEGER